MSIEIVDTDVYRATFMVSDCPLDCNYLMAGLDEGELQVAAIVNVERDQIIDSDKLKLRELDI